MIGLGSDNKTHAKCRKQFHHLRTKDSVSCKSTWRQVVDVVTRWKPGGHIQTLLYVNSEILLRYSDPPICQLRYSDPPICQLRYSRAYIYNIYSIWTIIKRVLYKIYFKLLYKSHILAVYGYRIQNIVLASGLRYQITYFHIYGFSW